MSKVTTCFAFSGRVYNLGEEIRGSILIKNPNIIPFTDYKVPKNEGAVILEIGSKYIDDEDVTIEGVEDNDFVLSNGIKINKSKINFNDAYSSFSLTEKGQELYDRGIKSISKK